MVSFLFFFLLIISVAKSIIWVFDVTKYNRKVNVNGNEIKPSESGADIFLAQTKESYRELNFKP